MHINVQYAKCHAKCDAEMLKAVRHVAWRGGVAWRGVHMKMKAEMLS
jgi:hypothetical protein